MWQTNSLRPLQLPQTEHTCKHACGGEIHARHRRTRPCGRTRDNKIWWKPETNLQLRAQFPQLWKNHLGSAVQTPQNHTHVYDARLCNLLKTFVLGIGRPTTRTASLASSAIRQRRDAWWATRNHSQRSPGGATGLCCFRVWGSFHWRFWGSFHWKEVILQCMTLNRSDKSLNCTYSTYSLLQGLRVPWIRCVCGSVFIILSDIRKLKWKHFLRIISKTFSLEWNSENGIHIQSRVYFLLWTSQ